MQFIAKYGLFILTASLFALATSPSVATHRAEPTELYGTSLLFDVYRNGAEVGSHSVSIDQEGSMTRISSVFDLEISFLFFTAYTFRYKSQGTWDDHRLVAFVSNVDDDGDRFEVKATQMASGLEISGPEGNETIAGHIFPTTHWNFEVVEEKRVLNSLTGKINDVQISAIEREDVETELGKVPATRYDYSGDLETTVWYDDSGRWVKMKFKGRDGSDIEYKCRRCQGGPTQANTND